MRAAENSFGEMLVERLRRLEAVYRLTSKVSAAGSVREMCEAAVTTLVQAVPGRRCSLLLFDPTGHMRFVAWRGISDEYRKAVDGHTPWKPGATQAQAFQVADATKDASLQELAPVFTREGIRSLAFIPLSGHRGVIGKFMIYGADPGELPEEELRLSCIIADHVAIAVERHTAEEALRSREAQLMRERALFTKGPVVVLRRRAEPGWPIEYLSDNARSLVLDAATLAVGDHFLDHVASRDRGRIEREVAEATAQGEGAVVLAYALAAGSGERELLDHVVLSRDEGRLHLDGYVLDVTERKQLERDLIHAQKMDCVGRLAAGVAHDFNNLLTIISTCAELSSSQLPGEHAVLPHLQSISVTANRAAQLTRQLLLFSRPQPTHPTPTSLNEVVQETASMLRRIIGENITISAHLSSDLWPVLIDRAQLQQVVVNLMVNARDAMRTGGTITLTTQNGASSAGSKDADWVTLTVDDTGEGMSPEVLSHLFEPFFTTKGLGVGSGLGLATTRSIIANARGQIRAHSEQGRGSTFVVELPRASSPPEPSRLAPPISTTKSSGRVLLVEDESLVRRVVTAGLEEHGFTVIAASHAQEALALIEGGSEYDVLLSDVAMPGMSGVELARALLSQRPTLPVILTSGYGGQAVEEICQEPSVEFIAKPFTIAALVERLRVAGSR